MTEPKKRGCLGCSFPIIIIVGIVAIAIFVIGFLAGPIGQAMFHIDFPSWLVVEKPEIHLAAPHLFEVFGFPITNTMLASWITVIFLVIGSWLITRHMKVVPNRLQVIFEFLLGWIYDLCESVAGKEYQADPVSLEPAQKAGDFESCPGQPVRLDIISKHAQRGVKQKNDVPALPIENHRLPAVLGTRQGDNNQCKSCKQHS